MITERRSASRRSGSFLACLYDLTEDPVYSSVFSQG